jgi:hypothetical protein
MFLPNDQNIDGLEPIVGAIRREPPGARRKKISLLFCPSNVPDLDDEDSILRRLLEEAERRLGYSRVAGTVHSYASLELLSQVPFTKARPNSRLAREYNELTTSIIAGNYEDRQGVVVALRRIRAGYRNAREGRSREVLSELSEATNEIRSYYGSDPEIAWLLAQVYDEMRSPEDEIAALTVAIEGGYQAVAARMSRGTTYMQLNDQLHAAEDFRIVLSSPEATSFEIAPAVEMLRAATNVDDWLSAVRSSPVIERLEPAAVQMVGSALMTDRKGLPLALEVWTRMASDPAATKTQVDTAKTQAELCMIGVGAFEEARKATSADRTALLHSTNIEDLFNYALAEWGEERIPPVDLFARVLEVAANETEERGANFHQCLALAWVVTGDKKQAGRELGRARETAKLRGREFSCWRYLEVGRRDLLADIAAMEELLANEGPFYPAFFDAVGATPQ